MSDKRAAWSEIHRDLNRVINNVNGMLLSQQFTDKESLVFALQELMSAQESILLACTPTENGH